MPIQSGIYESGRRALRNCWLGQRSLTSHRLQAAIPAYLKHLRRLLYQTLNWLQFRPRAPERYVMLVESFRTPEEQLPECKSRLSQTGFEITFDKQNGA